MNSKDEWHRPGSPCSWRDGLASDSDGRNQVEAMLKEATGRFRDHQLVSRIS